LITYPFPNPKTFKIMSFFDDASLAFLPSGAAGKDGKAYSIKPTDGTGDFTFSRGSNLAATRVGADGLIEKGRENLITYSNDFTQWVQANVDVTINAVQNPFNTGTTQTIAEQVGTSTQYRVYTNSYTTSSGTMYSHSVYVKRLSGTRDFAIIDVSGGARVYFNMTTISVGSEEIGKGKIEDVGNGWYRLSVYGLATGNSSFFLAMANGATTGSETYTSDGSGSFALYAAQLEIGLVATDYIESGATTGKAGLLEDEPRFDYSGGATCPSLLLEPSRTNLMPYSEYIAGLDDASSPVLSLESITNPSGSSFAYKVTATTTTSRVQESIGTQGNNFVFSGFFKGTGTATRLRFRNNQGEQVQYNIDASGNFTLNTEDAVNDNYDIEDYGNGWYRIWFETTTISGGTDNFVQVYPDVENGTGSVYAWGLQAEQGSYPTSYIPNHSGTGSVTRGADVCGDAGDASTFNDDEGVLYAEIAALVDDNDGSKSISISSGAYSNNIIIQYTTNTNQIVFKTSPSYTTPIFESYNVSDITENSKIAFKYKSNDCSFWHNGVKLGSVSSFTPFSFGTLTELNFNRGDGNEKFEGNTKQILYFPTALSDADCITLTTL
jgi:hypothetical protein